MVLAQAAVRSVLGGCSSGVLLARYYASTSSPTILLLDKVELAKKELDLLSEHANVVQLQAKSRGDFIKEVNSLSNVTALYRHFGGARSIKITGRFDQELISQLPSTLKFLCHNGAGYDQLDIEALTSKGIQASNVPTAVDDSTSTTALWLMIGALRKFALAQSQLASSNFNSKFPYKLAHDPGSDGAKVLGVVGAGGIGQSLARKANSAFGMKVVYHNRNRLNVEQEKAMCPGYDWDEAVATMKQSAVLINTARGPVVNEEELTKALEDEVIAGAGLDVFEKEPNVHPSLLAQSQSGTGKALLLPHIGTLSLGTQTEMEAVCLRNIMHGLKTGKLSFTVAEQSGIF